MASFRKSLAISFGGKYLMLVIRTGSTMILARLLTPREIGIYSIGFTVVGFAHVLREMGVSTYLVQERDLTEARLRTVFGIALASSFAFGAALALLAPAIAEFYDEPLLRSLLWIMSLNFLIIPFGSLVPELCTRDMQFGSAYFIAFAYTLVCPATVVTLAFHGWGVISMAWGAVVGNIAGTIASYIVRPQHIRLRPSLAGWRPIMRFGLLSAGGNLLAMLGDNVPSLVIGRVLGFTEVGLLSKANGLSAMFFNNVLAAFSPVAMAKLAQAHRAGRAIRADYLELQGHVTALAWPFFAGAIPFMFPIMRLMFGPQWDAAVPVAQVCCIAGLIGTPCLLDGSVFTATGAASRFFRVQRATVLIKIGLVAGASPFGLMAVAWAGVAVALISVAVTRWHVRHAIGATWRDMAAATYQSAAIAIATGAVAMLVARLARAADLDLAATLAAGVGACTLAWFGAIFALNHPMKAEIVSAARVTLGAVVPRMR